MEFRNRSLIVNRSVDWIKSHKYKALYYLMEAEDLEKGARALFQVWSHTFNFFWGTLFTKIKTLKHFKIKCKENKISHGRGNSLRNKMRGWVNLDSPYPLKPLPTFSCICLLIFAVFLFCLSSKKVKLRKIISANTHVSLYSLMLNTQ